MIDKNKLYQVRYLETSDTSWKVPINKKCYWILKEERIYIKATSWSALIAILQEIDLILDIKKATLRPLKELP